MFKKEASGGALKVPRKYSLCAAPAARARSSLWSGERLLLALRKVFTKCSSCSLPDEEAGGVGASGSELVGASGSDSEERGVANS